MNYNEFYAWTVELASKNETSGLDQTDEHKKYTQLNFKRMERWNKTFQISDETQAILNKLDRSQTWYVITETWCGDSAQILPIIAKFAEASNGKINLKIMLRDENPEWMSRYLTNGSKSIPKLIAFDEHDNELFNWGPRPEEAMEITRYWKANTDTIDKEQFHVLLHSFYAKNKGEAVQKELAKLIC